MGTPYRANRTASRPRRDCHAVEEKTGDVAPGSTATLRVNLSKDGSYEIYCPIDGHRGQGMVGTLAVGSGSSSGGMTAGETTTSGSPGY